MAVPYIFATATSSIPLSQLDTDLATPITIGNTAVQLGNTITTLYNMTLSNVTITSGTANVTANVTFNNANAVVYTNSSNVATTGTALTFDGTNLGVPAEVYRTTASSYLRLSGGDGAGSGANVIAFGQSHATAPGRLSLSSVGTGDIISNTISGAHIYQINSSEQMRLNSTGLGIGTSSFAGYLANKFVINTGTDSNNGITIASATNRNGSIWFADGTTGNQAYRGGVDYQHTTDTLYLYSGGNGNLLLDSSGNLGLGVTPSAWGLSGLSALQIKNASFFGYVNNAYMSANEYNDSAGTTRYIASAAATRYVQSAGTHAWYTAASGTAGNAITFTQAMTLDASGNLGVGTTSPGQKLHVAGNITSDAWIGRSNIAAPSADCAVYRAADNTLAFSTASNERARITSGGNLLVGDTAVIADERLYVRATASAGYAFRFYNTQATAGSTYGQYIFYSASTPNGTGNEFIRCDDSTANRFSLRSNGGLANYSANDVNLSDRREKTNFAPAKSYIDVICAIPVQTFNYIDQSEDDPGLTLGVVAQDVQAVAPELVMESNWGTKEDPKMRLSIYQTDLQYALMKCIQEQQAMINELKAEVAALKAK